MSDSGIKIWLSGGVGDINYLFMFHKHGNWEFREDISVPNDYKIDNNSQEYQLCKKRLTTNIRSKIPHYE